MPRTKEKKSDDSSLQLRQYYENIIKNMPNIVYLLDEHCSLTGCNANFLKLLDLDESTSIHQLYPYKQLKKLGIWSDERIELLKKADIDALLNAKPCLDVAEPPVFDKEGNIVYYQANRTPLLNSDNRVIGLLVVLIDVSDKHKLQEQLSLITNELQRSNAKAPVIQALSTHENDDKIPCVLMVEDNSIAQKAAQSLLMQLDCHVDIAESGDKAIALFEPGKYDLIFMDIGLEGTSGYVVSKRIRQLEKGTRFHVPIIALTGYEADVVKYDCDEYSMEGAMTKPLTSEQARQIIQHYIYHIDIPIHGLRSIKDSE